MQRFFAVLIAAIASIGVSTAVLAQKYDAPEADAKKAEPMDINSTSEKDLASLNGIGEVRAKAIVPENVYNDIKDKIVAKQK